MSLDVRHSKKLKMLELFLMILILSANLNDFRSNYTDCHKEVSVAYECSVSNIVRR